MAEIVFIAPVETIKGKLNKKDKTVFRRKRIFDAQGNVIGELSQESYVVNNPRDWKKNPPKGAEKQRIDNWAAACQRTTVELQDDTLRAAWQQRWQEQLKHPEAGAPIDPKTHKPKVYTRFDCYVRAAIFRELSSKI